MPGRLCQKGRWIDRLSKRAHVGTGWARGAARRLIQIRRALGSRPILTPSAPLASVMRTAAPSEARWHPQLVRALAPLPVHAQ